MLTNDLLFPKHGLHLADVFLSAMFNKHAGAIPKAPNPGAGKLSGRSEKNLNNF